ncbi:uncharacterized protein LOC100198524 isoform X3 [Hydra vulgaris]|uniref:Uncharacterized protein LOC100198524 isoform X3 n=1 Tax=Hydra vulgaris TaxID=6087 RepID=A0ABM4CIS4_HYDVU
MDGSTQEDEWEQCKENVQPLKGGRKITDLRKVLTGDGNEYMKTTIQHFEFQLRNTEGDLNQLDVWHSYITWMEQNSTQTKEVLPLLQRCMMFFKKKKTVNEHKKYVELWVKMSEAVDDPNLIFEYMFDHDIGTSLSLFYICWAEHFETIGAIKKSDELYNLGINRSAQPLDVLKEGKRMFEMRMAKSSSSKSVETENSREVLAGLNAYKGGKVPSNRIKKEVKKQTTSQKVSCSGPYFQIFKEESSSDSVLPAPSKGQSKVLPTDPSLHIENTKPVTTLKGTKIKAGGSSSSVSFPIYQEDVHISNTTLHKHVIIEDRKPLSAIKVSRGEPDFYKELPTNSKVVEMYCKARIYMGKLEFSFEELKAMTRKYAQCDNKLAEQFDIKSDKFKTKLDFSDMKTNKLPLNSSLTHCPPSSAGHSEKVNVIDLTNNELKPEVNSYLKELSTINKNAPLTKIDKNINLCPDIDITENLASKSHKVNQNNLGHLIDSLESTVCFPFLDKDKEIFKKKKVEPGNEANKNQDGLNYLDSLAHLTDSLEMTVCFPSVQNKDIFNTKEISPENPVSEKIYESNIIQKVSLQDVKSVCASVLHKETESTKRKSFNDDVSENKKLKNEFLNSTESSSLNPPEPLTTAVSFNKSFHVDISNNISQESTITSMISTVQTGILNDSFDLDKLTSSFYEEKECCAAETKKTDICSNKIPKLFDESEIKSQFALPQNHEAIGTYQESKNGVMLNVDKSSSSKNDIEHLKLLSSADDVLSYEKLFSKTPMIKKAFHKKDFFQLPAPSPSITLNTKYAKDNIQSLFNESLDFDIDATDHIKDSSYNGAKSSFLHDSSDLQNCNQKNVTLKQSANYRPFDVPSKPAFDIFPDTSGKSKVPSKPAFEILPDVPVQSKTTSKPVFEISSDAPVNSKGPLKPAFEIFSDAPVQSKVPLKPAFEIFPDAPVQSKSTSKPVFEIFSDAPVSSKALSKPAFEIFSDAPVQSKGPSKPAFEILPDAPVQSKTTSKPVFEIFSDASVNSKAPPKPAFEIFSDASVQSKVPSSSAFEIFSDPSVQSKVPLKSAFEIFSDVPANSKALSKPAFEIFSDDPVQSKVPSKSAFENVSDPSVQSKIPSKSAFEIFSDASVQSKVPSISAFEIFSDASIQSKVPSKSAFEILPDVPVQSKTISKPVFEIFSDIPVQSKFITNSSDINLSKSFGISAQSKDIPLPNKNTSLPHLTFFDSKEKKSLGFDNCKPFEVKVVSEHNKNCLDAPAHHNNTQDNFKKPLSVDENFCYQMENQEKVDKTTLNTFQLLSNTSNTSEFNSFKEDTTQIKQIPQRYSSTPFNGTQNKFISFDCSKFQFDGHTENIAFDYTKNENKAELSIINERSKEDTGGSDDSGSKTSLFNNETGYQYIEAFKKDFLEASLKAAMGYFTQSVSFLNINGKLPKLQGTEMELNLGPRKVRIRKSIKKNQNTASYKGVNVFSKQILLKISTGDGLKMLWDFYISILIQERINLAKKELSAKQNFIQHYFGLKYYDAVCIESPFYSEGTLKDLLDLYQRHNQTIDEVLIMLYAYEILRILQVLHCINIIHTNICLKNFIIGDCNTGDNVSPLDLQCLVLKGFYESIDLNNFCDDVMFVGSRGNEEYECPEMFHGSPWKFQVDYFAAASSIHFLIFQTNMNTYMDPNTKKLTICKSFKASWNDKIWTKFFSVLINFPSQSSFLSDLSVSLADELSQRSDELKIALSRKNDLIMEDE